MSDIIVITGQTATGKTSRAMQMAKEYNGELINADSRQVYKYLSIITGKDIEKTSNFHKTQDNGTFDIGYYNVAGNKLWLYDVVDPKQSFSSFDFATLTKLLIADISSRGKMPIIVGGSYFYIKHLLYGFETQNITPDWKLREELNKISVQQLREKLRLISSDTLDKMNESDQCNPRRLIRKIEVGMYNKLKLTEPVGASNVLINSLRLNLFVGLKHESSNSLNDTIKLRVKKRIDEGAFEEVEGLLKKGYSINDPGLNSIGYGELIQNIQGRTSREQAIKNWITHELQYAKRQFTFMKKDKNITWESV